MHFVPRDKRRITPTGARLFCQLSRMALLEADVNFRILKQPGNPLFNQVHWRCHRRAVEMASKSAFHAEKSSVASQRSRNSESDLSLAGLRFSPLLQNLSKNPLSRGGPVPPNPSPDASSTSSSSRRYNLSFGVSGRNIFNHNNPGPIIGNVTSPLFGRANQIAGSPNGEGFLETAGNRRIEMQVRFMF